VLLVSIDTLRADHLGCYGYPRATSPTLDRLAREGVRFERALSSSSWTLPAHVSMLTGNPVSAHGIDDDRLWTLRGADGAPLAPDLRGRFVSEALADAGYRTAGFYTWKYLEERFGFGPGFDTYERLHHTFYSHPVVGPRWFAAEAAGDRDAMRALYDEHPELFDDTRMGAPEVVARAGAWLDEHVARADDAPFFLFTHFFDVHDPYVSPEPFHSQFDPDYDGPIDGRRVTSPDSPVLADMPARDLENLVARYDGGIAYVDTQVAALLAHLGRLGLEEDTLVIVTSDHGEEFFEHGHKTHRRQLYLESVGVPLILRWPAGLPAGRVVGGNAGLVDIAPTICAAAGVELGARTAGVDLLPIARGAAENGARGYLSELLVFDESPVPARQLGIVKDDRQWLLETRGAAPWRVVASLDLAVDRLGSGAGAPLAGDAAAPALEYLARMRAALTRLRADLPRRAGELRPLSPFEQRELSSMGYGGHTDVEGGGGERLSLDGGPWPDE
jgi:arylsulfatase A-like enzyme